MNRILKNQFHFRNVRLEKAGFKNYAEFLKSDIWIELKKKWRRRISEKPDVWGRCRVCKTTENLLLHHTNYKNVLKPILSHVVPLCYDCHHEVHRFANTSKNLSLKTAVEKYKKAICKSTKDLQRR